MQDGEGAIQRQSCYGTRADTPGLERSQAQSQHCYRADNWKLCASTSVGTPMRQVPFELSLCFSLSALCHERR